MSSSKPPQGKRERLRGWGAKLSTRSRSGEPAQPSLAKPAANAQTTETNETNETTDLGQDRATSLPSRTSVASYHGTLNHESGGHRDLWAIALQRLPEKDREGLLVTDQTSQNNVIEQLSKELRQQKRSFEADAFQFTFRGRRIVPREIADRAITMLDKFKEIGDVAVNFDPVHAALPWAGVRFLLLIAVSEKKQRRELLLGTEKVLSMTGRYKILEMLYLREKNLTEAQIDAQLILQTDLVDTYTLVLEFLLKVKHIQEEGSVSRYSQAWFRIDKLSAFFEDAEQHQSSIDRAAKTCESLAAREDRGRSLETEKRVKDLQKLLEDFKNPLECIQSGVSYVYTQIEQSKRSDVLRWISLIAYETDHDTACKSRVNDSGRWLLQDDRFQAWWQSQSASIMWLHGLPGAGKTKLVSSVIDFAKSNRDESSSIHPGVELMYRPADSAIAYFYCDRNQEDHRDPRSILCSFVRQLSMSSDRISLHSHPVATYEKHKASGFATSRLSYEQALAHLQVLIQAPSQTFLILDALDECEESTRVRLVQDLQDLLTRCDHPVRIFISSRPNPDIKAELSKELNRAIGATDNRGDICKYVERMITDPRRTPPFWQTKLGSDVRQRVFEMLTQNAEGNFQWVALQIKQLHALSSTRDIETRLGKLPKTLKALYDEMYSRIQETEGCASYIAERAFKWVMCSYESLSPETLVDAVCQDPFTDAMDDVDDIDIDFVLQACHNLIAVDSSGRVCRFSHLSVQEYLENHRFGHEEAHELVATICLKSLYCLEASGPTNQSQLSKYAAMHWFPHVQRSYEAAPGNSRILSSLQRFLGFKDGTSPQSRSWLWREREQARRYLWRQAERESNHSTELRNSEVQR